MFLLLMYMVYNVCVFLSEMRSFTLFGTWFSQLMISSVSILVEVSLLKYSKNFLTVLSLCCWASGSGLSRLFSASELEDPLIGEDTEASQLYGPFPAENKHHPGLSGRPARRKRVLASGGNSFRGFGEKEF